MTNLDAIIDGMSEAQKWWVLSTPSRRITNYGDDAVAVWCAMPELFVSISGEKIFFGEATMNGFKVITEVLNQLGQAVRNRLIERNEDE